MGAKRNVKICLWITISQSVATGRNGRPWHETRGSIGGQKGHRNGQGWVVPWLAKAEKCCFRQLVVHSLFCDVNYSNILFTGESSVVVTGMEPRPFYIAGHMFCAGPHRGANSVLS